MERNNSFSRATTWIYGCIFLSVFIFVFSPGFSVLINNMSAVTLIKQAEFFSGILVWVLLTLCMVISARMSWINEVMGGLDKAYGIHKAAGITAILALLSHWCISNMLHWFVDFGWIILSPRPAGQGASWVRILAKEAGNWSLYGFVILVAVALVKMLPYQWFRIAHRLFPLAYIVGGVHSVLILSAEWWRTPAAYLVVLLSIAGSYAGLLSIMRKIGSAKIFSATVASIEKRLDNALDIKLNVSDEKVLAFIPGQFAFIDFGRQDGLHPFTIAGITSQSMRVIVKGLGDYTRELGTWLHEGDTVRIEGPYGCFDFKSEQSRQVWIAGGIGVTPFLAQLNNLIEDKKNNSQTIIMWYCAKSIDDEFLNELTGLCEKAGVQLHCVISAEGQRLNADMIHKEMKGLTDCSVWFCGPESFAKAMKKQLISLGLAKSRFHAERFNMR